MATPHREPQGGSPPVAAPPPWREHAEPVPSRAGGAAVSWHVRDREQRQGNVEVWQAKCAVETRHFPSEAEQFEYEFLKALHSSDHLGSPNAIRTAIVLDVLTKVGGKFARFEPLLTSIRQELELATYAQHPPQRLEVGFDASAAVDCSLQAVAWTGLSRSAFFTELKQALAEKSVVQDEVRKLDELYAFMESRLRSHEQMVDRLAQRWARLVLKQTLVDWKKLVIRKKYTRVLFDKTSGRWSKQRLLRIFRAWSAFAATERVRKAHEQIQQHREGRVELQELLVRLHGQVESAKAETRSHREHMDYSKRHVLSLEELLGQLELRVRNSRERKLQEVSNQWATLCFALVDCQCDHLQNMLGAVAPDEFVDVSLLLVKGEELADLLSLPPDSLVLRWINFQLAQCETFRSYYVSSPAGFIQNFSSDMHRNYVLRHIVYRILILQAQKSGDAMDSGLTAMFRLAPDRRGSSAAATVSFTPLAGDEDLFSALTQQLNPPCPPLLGSLAYGDKDSDLVFCLFSFLMCEHSSMAVAASPTSTNASGRAATLSAFPVVSPWQEARAALEDARRVWESIRDQWTELRDPFEIQESTKLTPDVTSPPQLLARANIALQNAVHSVQYACSKRSIAMRTWECLQRRVQDDALRLLVHRGRVQQNPQGLAPIELVDRRMWREKFMLTTLHVDKLAQVFTRMDAGAAASDTAWTPPAPDAEQRALVETELAEVELVLQEHYESLRHVYRFYASIDAATAGDTSGASSSPPARGLSDEDRFFRKIAMSMSLQEFHTFLKDCKMFGTARSFPYEFIQQVFEYVNSEVAASVEAATVQRLPSHFMVTTAYEESGSLSDDNPSEMTPAEFVEALVHIVRSPFVSLRVLKGAAVTGLTLAQRMRRCLEEVVLPNAMQEKEKSNLFRPLLLSSDCRAVFSVHLKKLLGVYTHFAAREDAGSSTSSTSSTFSTFSTPSTTRSVRGGARMLSVDGLVSCCKHLDLLRDNLVNLDDIQHVLAQVLQLDRESIHFSASTAADGSASSSPADEPEREAMAASALAAGQPPPPPPPLLTFAEFLEALAALACYLNPDAFVPLATKLDLFFADLRV